MLCIFSFIIFLLFFPILGIFPEYRKLFRRSWSCVFKKVTLKPCDINLGQELKNAFLSKIFFKFPRFAKFLDRTFSFWAFLFIVINIWSLVYTLVAATNLWVYDTCDPATGESCSLSGEACGVASNSLTFNEALRQNQLGQWVIQPFSQYASTVSKIPDRMKNWEAENYLAPKPTYYLPFDSNKPTAVEFVDPGCSYCKKLYNNIKTAGFEQRYNLSYVIYPIPDKNRPTGYKFQASYIIATYLEAVKRVPLENSQTPADWQLLSYFFTEKDVTYIDDQIAKIRDLTKSEEVKADLEIQKQIVEQKVKTIRIPTIIFDGRRYDRVIDGDKLR
jgi:thiol-disulfide isomerase/thioredoxin